jgi:uncharacterized membrane protein (DUF106 family)
MEVVVKSEINITTKLNAQILIRNLKETEFTMVLIVVAVVIGVIVAARVAAMKF